MAVDCDSERIWKTVEKYILREKAQRRPESHNIFDNLYNSYIDNCQSCQDKRFRSGVRLLQKLSPELALVSIVIKLYEDEDGYSIMVGPSEQTEVFLPYENNDIFCYIDAGEIPPVVLEVIENTNHCHFYSGCLVCEIRNYRIPQTNNQEEDAKFESTLVLLKPSHETVLRYVNEVCSSNWSSLEERLAAESKLLLATQSPLCLEPEIDVVCVQNRLHYNKRKYHSLLSRYMQAQSQAKRAKIHLYSNESKVSNLLLHKFLSQHERQDRSSKKSPVNIKRKQSVKLYCDIGEVAQTVSKNSKSYQSDVHSLIHPPQPPVVKKETPVVDEVQAVKNKTTPPKPVVSKPSGLVVTIPLPSTREKKTTSTKTQEKVTEKIVPKSRPISTTHRSHIPGKTTITVLSTWKATHRGTVSPSIPNVPPSIPNVPLSIQNMPPSIPNVPPSIPNIPSSIPNVPPSIPNLPPKLRSIGLKANAPQTSTMPRLKPLEAHKGTPSLMMSKNKPPPLAPPPPVPKQQPLSSSTMPQLHKIQLHTSDKQQSTTSTSQSQ